MKQLVALLFILSIGSTFAQNDSLLMILESDSIYLAEFEHVYNKNRNTPTAEVKTPEEYLELFINFKLKVLAAEEAGLDTMPRFKRELKGYRKDLARPYLNDAEVTEALVDEAFERYQKEIRARHILFSVNENASPQDTLRVYNQAVEVRKRILAGTDFVSMARRYSEDPSVKDNGGDLGYFTALYMVYPFESAAFNTAVGEVSMPIRTRFGFHLIEITDSRPARGQRKVAHILIQVEEGDTAAWNTAKRKADEVYQKAVSGEDFTALAVQYSDDKTSASAGGELRWFGSGVMVEEFEEGAFSLDSIGQVSEPVRTQFGYHIIRLMDIKGPPNREEDEFEVRRKIKGDVRAQKSQRVVIDRLMAEYAPVVEEKNLVVFEQLIDESFYRRAWKPEIMAGYTRPVLSFADTVLLQSDFAEHLGKLQFSADLNQDKETMLRVAFKNFSEKAVMSYENDHLEEKYPDFKMLYKEYRDGILLFELMDDEVWSKAVKDTAGLEAYYEANKTKYMWPKRARMKVHTANDEKVAAKMLKYLEKGKTTEWIAGKLNADSELPYQVEEGLYTSAEFPGKTEDWKVGLSPVEQTDRGYQVFEVLELLEPMPKELNESKGIIISDYQRQLEEQWIEELRATYSYEVFPMVLEHVQ
jgi:peptidyl-prolyl cis-trans isomerase SurA